MTPKLALVALALAAGPSAAAEPRSAIPWLSESIVLPPAAPLAERARPAVPSAAPTAPGAITMTPLAAVGSEAVGLLPPGRTGLPKDLWGPTSALKARALILDHPEGGVPEARALFRRLLLAEADPPPGAGSGSGLLVARVDRLLGMGAVEEAEALIALGGPDSPALFRRWFDAGLLLDRAEPACAALRDNPALSPTLPARVFCLARGGDWNAAEITLTLGRDLGEITPEGEAALARFLDPALFEGELDPAPPDPLTPLDFLLREAVGLPRPAGALPLAFLHADLAEYAPMRVRITSGERLVLSGALPGNVLFAAYRAGEPAASGGVWDRAAAVQALDAAFAEGTPEAVGPALEAADAALSARGLRVALAEEYAGRLAALDPAALDEAARGRAFELLLLGGRREAARRAAGAAPEGREAALLALAGTGPAPDRTGIADARLAAALAGLDAVAPSDPREERLAALLAEERVGEAVIGALDLLAAGPLIDPPALRAAVFALAGAGLREPARRIALQTLLAPEG